MNLKEVANHLGVHYQTVYRWVRSGDLPAIKVGAQYAITEAGLDLFRRRREERQSVIENVVTPNPQAGQFGLEYLAETVREDPAAFFEECVRDLVTLDTRGAVVATTSSDGQRFEPQRSFSRAPQLRLDFAARIAIEGFPVDRDPWREVNGGALVHLPHTPFSLSGPADRPHRGGLEPELQCHSWLASPIWNRGHVAGLVAVASLAPGDYSLSDLAPDLRATAELASGALERQQVFAAARFDSQELHDRVTLAHASRPSSVRVLESVSDLLNHESAAAVFRTDGSLLAATDALPIRLGVDPAELAIQGVRALRHECGDAAATILQMTDDLDVVTSESTAVGGWRSVLFTSAIRDENREAKAFTVVVSEALSETTSCVSDAPAA